MNTDIMAVFTLLAGFVALLYAVYKSNSTDLYCSKVESEKECVKRELRNTKVQADACQHVAETYIEMYEHRAEELKQLQQYENLCTELSQDNLEMIGQIASLKRQVLDAKGYERVMRKDIITGSFGDVTHMYQTTDNYSYYMVDLHSRSLTPIYDTSRYVYDMDQRGEIYPTKQAAGEELARLIEEDEANKDYIKTRYGKGQDGN